MITTDEVGREYLHIECAIEGSAKSDKVWRSLRAAAAAGGFTFPPSVMRLGWFDVSTDQPVYLRAP